MENHHAAVNVLIVEENVLKKNIDIYEHMRYHANEKDINDFSRKNVS